jgi:hypothetical protein
LRPTWDPAKCQPYCWAPNIFLVMGGTYARFSADEIAGRYPDQVTFQDLRTRAADQLLADRYILKEDRDRIAADNGPVPEIPPPASVGGRARP